MSQITISNLYFHYDSPYLPVFSGLSLSVSEKWKTALIGKNGRGKTTLLNLLSGKIKPTSGTITAPLEIKSFPYTPQNEFQLTGEVIKESIAPFSFWEKEMDMLLGKGDEESLSSYSHYLELFMHHEGYTIDSIMEKEALKMGLSEDILNRPFHTLSGGEKTRALILSLFLRKDSFPLLDEPTDHLDLKGREMLAGYLAASSKGFICASHDRYLLDESADHVISINPSGISLSRGNYSTWKYQKDIEEEFEQRKYTNLEREIKDLEKAASQRRRWSAEKEKEKTAAADSGFISHRAAKVMQRAVSIEKRIEENLQNKRELLKDREVKQKIKMRDSATQPDRLIAVNGLSVSFGEREIISQFYLEVNRGERIAITGKNGCGKTTLFNVLNGKLKSFSGDLFIARNINKAMAYQVPLWRKGLLNDHLKSESIDMTRFRFIMSAFDLKGDIFDRPLETFSKGQLRKIDLCRSIVSSPQLLLWDEPLNHLDIESREQLEEFILNEEPTIVFVEHDRRFIENCATRVVRMENKVSPG